MCKRQAGVKLADEEKGLEGIIDDISEDHAKLILDRLELLSKLREVYKHPKLDERLKLCQNNPDTPDWWQPGKHDRELVRAVLKHGIYRSEVFILNDVDFCFNELEKRFTKEIDMHMKRSSIKAETHADLLNFDKNEILVKLEKGEGTLKIEKVNLKKENSEISENEKLKIESEQPVEETLEVKNEEKEIEKEKQNDKEIEIEKEKEKDEDNTEAKESENDKEKDIVNDVDMEQEKEIDANKANEGDQNMEVDEVSVVTDDKNEEEKKGKFYENNLEIFNNF